MMLDRLYDTADEAHVHEDAIESLVTETHMPLNVVRSAYEHELGRLKRGARIKDYLVLFATRKTREALRAKTRGQRS